MATSKKVSSPVVSPAATVADDIRFTIGAAEIGAAENWLEATVKVEDALSAFFDRVIVAHRINLSDLDPVEKGKARTNEAAAAHTFVRGLYVIKCVGHECAALMADKNVPGDRVLQPLKRKPQTKRQLIQSVTGGNGWGVFVKSLKDEALRRDVAAKVAAGEMTEEDAAKAGKRGAATKNPLKTRALNAAATLCKILRTDAEKHDGSFDPKIGEKAAALISDVMSSNGFK